MNAVPMNAVPAARQKGVMLIIVLIVLVAMTLAGVAMMRSVDTSTVVAGNIAFKQSGVGAADQGLQAAYTWLIANTGAPLNSDSFADGYVSNAPGTEPDWTSNANWANEKQLNGGVVDGAGNVISYLIHRMCPIPNCAPDATCPGGINTCGSTANTATVSGEGVDVSKPAFFSLPPSIHYRITARTVGPRNTLPVVQTMVRTQ